MLIEKITLIAEDRKICIHIVVNILYRYVNYVGKDTATIKTVFQLDNMKR